MRQYVILYRRGNAKDFGRLHPGEHAGLYDRVIVKETVEFMRQHDAVEATYVRLADECFQIVAFKQEADAPNAFKFDESPPVLPNSDFHTSNSDHPLNEAHGAAD